jgi:ferrochelatase
VRNALARLPVDVRDDARVVFTAHSIPVSMAEQYPYREQIAETARLVMARMAGNASVGRDFSRAQYAIVYQSRSGRPEDPWIGPDVCDYLRACHADGLRAAVVAPIGFVCDHVEVLFDLDVEAADVCREIGLPMARASAVNDHPRFLDALAGAVIDTCRRYDGTRPLQVVAG